MKLSTLLSRTVTAAVLHTLPIWLLAALLALVTVTAVAVVLGAVFVDAPNRRVRKLLAAIGKLLRRRRR